MNAQHTPDWDAIAHDLRAARRVATAEHRLHGRVLPETMVRLNAAIARAVAAYAIDDAKATGVPA